MDGNAISPILRFLDCPTPPETPGARPPLHVEPGSMPSSVLLVLSVAGTSYMCASRSHLKGSLTHEEEDKAQLPAAVSKELLRNSIS